MTPLNRVELAIRRAASQMPNHQSRAFRLVADELAAMEQNSITVSEGEGLNVYRNEQRNIP